MRWEGRRDDERVSDGPGTVTVLVLMLLLWLLVC
jgi:hypothetical protein